jgi:hypothetical protein
MAAAEQLRSALVVLAAPPTGPGGYTSGDPAGVPEGAEAVRTWFGDHGFDVDPVVGIAFSISGPDRLFRGVFGPAADGAVELDRAALTGRLEAAVLDRVAAVSFGPAPDFGPGLSP